LEEIREVKLPNDLEILESFLMVDPIEFLWLILCLREKRFPQAYVGISEGSIKTLVTIEKLHGIRIWSGDVRFIEPILKRWGPSRGHLSVGVKHLRSALKIYRPVRVFDEVLIMFVDKEHFIFEPKHKPERLSSEELPKPWTKDFKGIAYGIRVNGKIASCGSVSNIIDGIGSCGAAIGTDPEERNKGYATSILSYAVRDALKLVPIVTYSVESDNIPTIRVLEKLGFRLYSAFLYTEVEKRKSIEL